MLRAHERDPILLTERYLIRHGIMSENEVKDLRSSLQAEVNQAADEADAAPQPAPGHITERIYSDKTPFFEEKPPVYVSEDTISMVEAINRGLREEMDRNPKIVMWGEDITIFGLRSISS